MANSAKLYAHPTITGAFILETNQGNYEITNDFVKKTTINGSGYQQVFDMLPLTVLDNAKAASVDVLGTDAINALISLVSEKVEDGE